MVRIEIIEATQVARSNVLYNDWNKLLSAGDSRELTASKEDDKRYVFEWYYMYNGQLCKKSSVDVVEHPKFYQNKMAYGISADNVELIGATDDLELAVVPAKVTWCGKDYSIAAASESAFANCGQLKAIVDLNGNAKTEQLKTTAPIYVADAKGNANLKEFVNWDNGQLTYTGKTAKLGWTDNLKDFGVTAKADAQTSQAETGEYTDSIDFTFTYQQQPFAVKIPCHYTIALERAQQQIVWEQDLQALDQYAQLELTAKATSGLPVSYLITQGGDACSIVKVGQNTFLDCFGAGNVTLAAWQEGNKNYYPTLRTYKQVNVISGIGEIVQGSYKLSSRQGVLLISGLQAGDTVSIHDMAGRQVYSGQDDHIRLARGSYVVRIGRWLQKVLVK